MKEEIIKQFMKFEVRFMMVIILTLIIAFVINATQDDGENIPPVSWQVYEWAGDARTIYEYEDCCIVVTEDHGITVVVSESYYTGSIFESALAQAFFIGKNNNDVPMKIIEYSMIERRSALHPSTGYDIFESHYLEAALELPVKVREKFMGFYNL